MVTCIGITGVLALASAIPVQATATLAGATPNLSATVNIPDPVMDGPDCVKAPMQVTYTKTGGAPGDISGYVKVSARYTGSNSSIDKDVYVGFSAAASGSITDQYLFICPYEVKADKGPLNVTGSIESSINFGAKTVVPLPAGALTVVRNTTSISQIKTKRTSGLFGSYKVSGLATAVTPSKGTVGAGGRLTLMLKKKGQNNWVAGSTTSADSFGAWSFDYISPSKYPRGTAFKVTLSECSWCTDATAQGVLK